jgi:hypothetical protein
MIPFQNCSLSVDVTFGKLEAATSLNSAHQKTRRLYISESKLENRLKFITSKYPYKTTSFSAHIIFRIEIQSKNHID